MKMLLFQKQKIMGIRRRIASLNKELDFECGKKQQSSNTLDNRLAHMKAMLFHPHRVLNVLTGRELYLDYVEIVLTTVCNLRCYGCSALMPFYKKQKHLDCQEIIDSLKRLIDSVDSIYELRLLGGEPLCYPHLIQVLRFLKDQPKVKSVAVVTNATLLVRDDNVLDVMKDNKFYFSISKYLNNVSLKYDELVGQLHENGIRYIPMSEDRPWTDYGDFTNRNRTDEELKEIYYYCKKLCWNIMNGKLFRCPRCSHGTYLNFVPLKDSDYVDLLDMTNSTDELRRELFKFYYGYVPYVECCKYCDNTRHPKYITPGEQVKKRTDVI